jgi:hypothetical protein
MLKFFGKNADKIVIIRKIIGTLRNEKGTRIYETITSMLATWR